MSGRFHSALALDSALAEALDPMPPVIAELQQWLADHLHLPVNYFGNMFRSKDWFLRHYATVIGPAQRPIS
jgi:hypothetical protein